MRVPPFRMERMQSLYENVVAANLAESGVEPMSVRELVGGRRGAMGLLDSRLGYPQTNGTVELRERIAAFYDGATRDQVLVTNGGSEANYATFWSLLEKGDRVAFMLPNYLQGLGLARAYAGRVDPFRMVLRRENGQARWALDLNGLERAVTRNTRVVLVTNPNNPTGGVLTEEEMEAVVRAARRAGAWIVADEIYRGAEIDGRTTPSFWGRYNRVLVTSGLSKAFGLPGLRIGWVVGPRRIVDRIWSYRDYTTIAAGSVSNRLAAFALEPGHREAIFARTRRILNRNLPVLLSWIERHRGVLECVPPRAGAIILARYRLGLSSARLGEYLRARHSVLIVPGDHLGIPRHIRIGFGYELAGLADGLRRIDAAMAALAGRQRGSASLMRRRASASAPSRSTTRPSSCIS